MGLKTLIYLVVALAAIWFTANYFRNHSARAGDGKKTPGKIEKYLKKPIELRNKINKATEDANKNRQKTLDALE